MNNLKKYSEYSDKISKEELFDGLLGQGLFADKLPDFLTSLNFLKYWKDLEKDSKKSHDCIINTRNYQMQNLAICQ